MVTGILAYFSTNTGAVPLVRSTFSSFPAVLVASCTPRIAQLLPVLVLSKKEGLLGQGDRLSNEGIAKEPAHAKPNNELAALRNSIL